MSMYLGIPVIWTRVTDTHPHIADKVIMYMEEPVNHVIKYLGNLHFECLPSYSIIRDGSYSSYGTFCFVTLIEFVLIGQRLAGYIFGRLE